MSKRGELYLTLYVSDLDGTLLNSEQQLSNVTINIINKLIEEGMKFSVATARSFDSAGRLIKPLNLKVPIIVHNGVFIYDPVKEEYIVSNYLETSMVKDILRICKETNVEPIIFTRNEKQENRVYYKGISNYGEEHYIKGRLASGDKRFTLVDDLSICLKENIINILVIGDNEGVGPVYDLLRDRFDANFHYTLDIYSKTYWLEITHKNANKREAVKCLKELLKAEKLVCFGDNLNDSPMFDIADERCAVENAHQALKDAATCIIGSNNDDGVAKYLKSVSDKENTA